jgi:hypothetical protein
MAMIFIDGFDYLTAANIALKWSTGSVGLNTGVYGKGKSINGNATINVANAPNGMVGFHFYTGTQVAEQIVIFSDAGTNQIDLRTSAIGQLFFTRNGTTIGTTTGSILAPNQWYWIEVQITISTTVGIANLYVNAVSVLAQSGLDTQTSGNAYFNQIEIASSANQTQLFDSFHYWNSTAGDVTTYPYGEHIIDTQLANAVGSNTTWNKGGSTINAQNYEQVNEANEDGDTTYVWMSASGAGDIDTYGWAPLVELSGNIGTIAINTISRIDDPGPHIYDHYTLSSGVPALSSGISPGSSYINHQTFQGTDPDTSNPWTVTSRNNAQFGYEFIS